MLYNIKPLLLQRVFHGIRFKVKKIYCRETINFFLFYTGQLYIGSANIPGGLMNLYYLGG